MTRATAARLERRAQRETRLYDIRRIAFVQVGPGGPDRGRGAQRADGRSRSAPDVAGLSAPAGPVTVSATGQGPRYRVVTSSLPGGGMLATAISLDDVDTALVQRPARAARRRPGRPGRHRSGGVDCHPARPATPRPHGRHRRADRRGPHRRAGRRHPSRQRGRPPRHRAQPHARSDRRVAGGAHGVGAEDAPVRGRRLARAPDPTDGDPRLRRAVSPGGRRRRRRGHVHGPHRTSGDPHGRAGRRPGAARPPRPGPPAGGGSRRSRGHGRRRRSPTPERSSRAGPWRSRASPAPW